MDIGQSTVQATTERYRELKDNKLPETIGGLAQTLVINAESEAEVVKENVELKEEIIELEDEIERLKVRIDNQREELAKFNRRRARINRVKGICQKTPKRFMDWYRGQKEE